MGGVSRGGIKKISLCSAKRTIFFLNGSLVVSMVVYSCYQVIQLCKEFGVFIGGVLHDSDSFITIVVESDGRGNGVHGSLFQDRSHLFED